MQLCTTWCPFRAAAVRSGRTPPMPRVVQIPDIRKVDLPEARQAIPHVHAYLRECILDGTLPPGTKLSQVSLAAQLGIAVRSGRTPPMPRVVQIPDIRKVDLPEARQAIPHVHAYLRECILDGTLPQVS